MPIQIAIPIYQFCKYSKHFWIATEWSNVTFVSMYIIAAQFSSHKNKDNPLTLIWNRYLFLHIHNVQPSIAMYSFRAQ